MERDLSAEHERNYDVIALVEQQGWGKPVKLHFALCAGEEYHAILGELFGPF
jgi:hypothetical protein